jgi:hypothetical protein
VRCAPRAASFPAPRADRRYRAGIGAQQAEGERAARHELQGRRQPHHRFLPRGDARSASRWRSISAIAPADFGFGLLDARGHRRRFARGAVGRFGGLARFGLQLFAACPRHRQFAGCLAQRVARLPGIVERRGLLRHGKLPA